ncbi:hypothetical protein M427DRAFT_59267 [Gonapodya prolifera JEL478]|uniref:Uncharacterized protein n=1 Tax=Gonapodya prolifera (strain JEL478) TaxID=1344416 RepID=A0A139A7H2_GONPJ|nr:hypothetical protein M427DRAFT_59267 [Gonapodya prolifera JEL478]|eukprot:KXS12746.1 hypothetical protein M427DRAFT_59267 [Gonapodya prolifera JEL478]
MPPLSITPVRPLSHGDDDRPPDPVFRVRSAELLVEEQAVFASFGRLERALMARRLSEPPPPPGRGTRRLFPECRLADAAPQFPTPPAHLPGVEEEKSPPRDDANAGEEQTIPPAYHFPASGPAFSAKTADNTNHPHYPSTPSASPYNVFEAHVPLARSADGFSTLGLPTPTLSPTPFPREQLVNSEPPGATRLYRRRSSVTSLSAVAGRLRNYRPLTLNLPDNIRVTQFLKGGFGRRKSMLDRDRPHSENP